MSPEETKLNIPKSANLQALIGKRRAESAAAQPFAPTSPEASKWTEQDEERLAEVERQLATLVRARRDIEKRRKEEIENLLEVREEINLLTEDMGSPELESLRKTLALDLELVKDQPLLYFKAAMKKYGEESRERDKLREIACRRAFAAVFAVSEKYKAQLATLGDKAKEEERVALLAKKGVSPVPPLEVPEEPPPIQPPAPEEKKKCPNCGAMFIPSDKCPFCGYKMSPETPPTQPPTESEAGAEKERAMAALRETIENAKRTLEENRKKEEEILRRLAEIRSKKIENHEIKTPETLEEIEARIAELDREIYSLLKQEEKKRTELGGISKLRVIKYNKAEKEWRELNRLINEKINDRRELDRKRDALRDETREREEREREEAREREEREREEALERDRQQNPFKHYLLDKIGPRNFEVMFSVSKKEALLEQVNKVMGETGRDLTYWNPSFIIPERDEAVVFSSNGFYLRIKNKNEVKGEKGIQIANPQARYDLVGPGGEILDSYMNYDMGRGLLEEKAGEYQAEQLALFESNRGEINKGI